MTEWVALLNGPSDLVVIPDRTKSIKHYNQIVIFFDRSVTIDRFI